MKFLVDANVLSEMIKAKPESRVVDWLDENEDNLWVSVITFGEIERGILLLPSGKRRANLMAWFLRMQNRFKGKTIVVDEAVMEHWAALYAAAEIRGRRLQLFDSLLAATAQCHGLTVATRNMRDFPAGVARVNPWEA